MSRTITHSVPASVAGIVFQFDRAMFHLSASREGSVGVETHDDVARSKEDYQLWEQDKLSFQNSGHPLTDRSKNLWNTLLIWVKKLEVLGVDVEHVELSLVTNRPVPACLIREISIATKDEEALACVVAMRAINSKDVEVQALIDSVLTARGFLPQAV